MTDLRAVSFALASACFVLPHHAAAQTAAVIGSFIGHRIRREVWRQVDSSPVRVAIVPSAGRGVQFTASVAF